jgi:hypothetical protein
LWRGPLVWVTSTRHSPHRQDPLPLALADHERSLARRQDCEWSRAAVAALDKAVEQSNVKFSHNQHLDPDRVLRRGDSKPLNCADCHRLEPDGEHFEPITMEKDCGSCHSLAYGRAGGQLLSTLLKAGIDRPRPDLVSHLANETSLSFPSGHAMLSAVTYLTLGSLAARFLPGRTTKIYVLSLAVLITLLVGVSRVYLGVHWPSDVLAGWCAGFAWAMLCWLAARMLQRSKAVADSGSEPED